MRSWRSCLMVRPMRRREAARKHIRTRAAYWAGRLKIALKTVRVQRMARKWGSCSSGGIVTLAEDLADQDKRFQDFVIVHELLHLRVQNHGRLFKALMSLNVPGWQAARFSATAHQELIAPVLSKFNISFLNGAQPNARDQPAVERRTCQPAYLPRAYREPRKSSSSSRCQCDREAAGRSHSLPDVF